MGENKEGENWQSNPSLSGIDPDKMRFLTQMMGEVGGKDPAAALPFLSALSGSETGQKMNFSGFVILIGAEWMIISNQLH